MEVETLVEANEARSAKIFDNRREFENEVPLFKIKKRPKTLKEHLYNALRMCRFRVDCRESAEAARRYVKGYLNGEEQEKSIDEILVVAARSFHLYQKSSKKLDIFSEDEHEKTPVAEECVVEEILEVPNESSAVSPSEVIAEIPDIEKESIL